MSGFHCVNDLNVIVTKLCNRTCGIDVVDDQPDDVSDATTDTVDIEDPYLLHEDAALIDNPDDDTAQNCLQLIFNKFCNIWFSLFKPAADEPRLTADQILSLEELNEILDNMSDEDARDVLATDWDIKNGMNIRRN